LIAIGWIIVGDGSTAGNRDRVGGLRGWSGRILDVNDIHEEKAAVLEGIRGVFPQREGAAAHGGGVTFDEAQRWRRFDGGGGRL
jgi:hypothetical protein